MNYWRSLLATHFADPPVKKSCSKKLWPFLAHEEKLLAQKQTALEAEQLTGALEQTAKKQPGGEFRELVLQHDDLLSDKLAEVEPTKPGACTCLIA